MRKCARLLVAWVLAGLMPLSASAGEGILIAPATRFESGVKAEYRYTDNFYWTRAEEDDANIYLIKPELDLSYTPANGVYRLSYSGEVGEVDESSKDDYLDHRITASAKLRPLAKHSFEGDVSYIREHDDYGTVRTSGLRRLDDRDLDKWEEPRANLKYIYGSESARLNWFLSGHYFDREYYTNKNDPLPPDPELGFPGSPQSGTRLLDRDKIGPGAGFSYTVTPRSKFLAEYKRTYIDYDVDDRPNGSLDGTLDQLLFGYRWLATGKTSGEVWVGGFRRDFDDSDRDKGEGISWLGRVTWAPRTYSIFTFETGQAVQDAITFGEDFVDTWHAGIRWDHYWSTRFFTFAGYRFRRDDYEGFNRDDDFHDFTAGSGFELSRHYSVTLTGNYVERDSNQSFFDFERTYLLLSFNATY